MTANKTRDHLRQSIAQLIAGVLLSTSAVSAAVTGNVTVGFDGWQRTVSYNAPSAPVIDATGRYIFAPGTVISWTGVTWAGGGSAPFTRTSGWDGVTLNPRRRTGHARDSRNTLYNSSFLATSPYTLQTGDVLDFFQSVSDAERTAITTASRVGPGDTVLVVHCETNVPTPIGNELLFAPCVTRGPNGQRVSDSETVDFSALYAARPTTALSGMSGSLPPIAEFKELIAREWDMNTLTDKDIATGGYEAFAPYRFCYQIDTSGYSGNMVNIYLMALYFLAEANTSEADWIHIAKWIFRQGKDAIDPYLSETRVNFHGRNFYNVGNNGGGHSSHNEPLAVFYAYGKGDASLLADWTREIRINWEQCFRHTAKTVQATTVPHTDSRYPEFSHKTTITSVIASSTRADITGEPAIKIMHPYTGNRTAILGMDVLLTSTGEKLGTTRNRIGGESVNFLAVSDKNNIAGPQHELPVNSISNFSVGQEVYFQPFYPIRPGGYDFSITGCFIADDDGDIYTPPAMGDNTAVVGFHNYSAAASAQYKGNQNVAHAVAALYIGAFAPSVAVASPEVNALIGCGICGSRPTIQWGPWNTLFNDTWLTTHFTWTGLSLDYNAGNLFNQAGAALLSATRLGTDQPNWTQPDEWFLGPEIPKAVFSADPVSGSIPLTVTFFDNSEGILTNRLWNFGDGSVTNTTATTLTHTYTSAGSFTVSLTVSGNGGPPDTNMQTGLIIAIHPETEGVNISGNTADTTIGINTNGIMTVLWAGETILQAGDNAFDWGKGDMCAVLVFQLPDPGEKLITAASLAADIYCSYPAAESYPAGLDLYAIRTSSSSTVTTDDYGFKGTGSGTLIQQDFFSMPSSILYDWEVHNSSLAGEIALGAWLQARYDEGAQSGDYVFLRLESIATTANPIKIASADSATQAVPVLTINLATLPSTNPPPHPVISAGGNGSFGNGQDILNWTTVQGSGYVYSVWYSTNLMENFHPLETNLPDTVQSITNRTSAPSVFYQIRAE